MKHLIANYVREPHVNHKTNNMVPIDWNKITGSHLPLSNMSNAILHFDCVY